MTYRRRLVARLATWMRGAASPQDGLAFFTAPHDANMLRVLCDEAPMGVVVIDATGKILRTNAALRAMSEEAAALTPGTRVSRLFADRARASAVAELDAVLTGRMDVPRRFVSHLAGDASGQHRAAVEPTVSISAALLRGTDGRVSGALLHVFDLTHQMDLEAQLAHGQKLQAIGQLAGGVAHDFNNLLTAIIGAADSIAARDALDSETVDDVVQIRSSAERGAALVRHLLAIGRQQMLQPQLLAVNDVILAVSGLLRRMLGGKIRLVLDLEEPGRHVSVDPTQLDQVLVNLAVNARDAMPQGGVLTLRSGHRALLQPLIRGPETIPPGRYAMFAVTDTGIGIPAEMLDHIFDPFFTTKREQGGTGLGLSTVHGIISQSGGYLEVDTTPGQGTEFRVFLPRCDPPETALPQSAPRDEPTLSYQGAAHAGARNVLLVDDEEPVLRLAERMLRRHGWQVLAATSGEAALALLTSHQHLDSADNPQRGAHAAISAVITDMVMPGMDGVALVRAVRRRLDDPELPAILVSGYAEETLRRDFESANTHFLAKPYTLKALVALLETATRPIGDAAIAD